MGKAGESPECRCRDLGPMFGDTECPDAEGAVYSCTPGSGGQEIVNHVSEARAVTNTEIVMSASDCDLGRSSH